MIYCLLTIFADLFWFFIWVLRIMRVLLWEFFFYFEDLIIWIKLRFLFFLFKVSIYGLLIEISLCIIKFRWFSLNLDFISMDLMTCLHTGNNLFGFKLFHFASILFRRNTKFFFSILIIFFLYTISNEILSCLWIIIL